MENRIITGLLKELTNKTSTIKTDTKKFKQDFSEFSINLDEPDIDAIVDEVIDFYRYLLEKGSQAEKTAIKEAIEQKKKLMTTLKNNFIGKIYALNNFFIKSVENFNVSGRTKFNLRGGSNIIYIGGEKEMGYSEDSEYDEDIDYNNNESITNSFNTGNQLGGALNVDKKMMSPTLSYIANEGANLRKKYTGFGDEETEFKGNNFSEEEFYNLTHYYIDITWTIYTILNKYIKKKTLIKSFMNNYVKKPRVTNPTRLLN